MAQRYKPEATYRPPGVSFAQVDTAEALANVLDGFRRRVSGWNMQMQADRGAQEGAKAGVSGPPPKKANWTAYGRAYNSAAENAYLAAQNIDIEDTFNRLEDEAQGNPQKFEELSRGYVQGLMRATPAHLQPGLELLARARMVDGSRRVTGQAQQRAREEQRVTTREGLDVMIEQARRLATQDGPEAEAALGVLQEQIVGTITTAATEGLFTPAEAYELRLGYMERLSSSVSEAQVKDEVSRIMGGYQADILAGDKLLAALDSSDFDDDTKTAIRSEVRQRLNLLQDERKRAHVEDLAALHKDIADGVPSRDAEQQAFKLYRRGAMETGAYQSMVAAIERSRVQAAKDAAAAEAAQQVYDGSQPLDPKDTDARRAMDKLFAEQVAGVARGSPEYQNAAIEMTRRTNIVPSDAVSWARTTMAGADPEQAALAAQFLTRMEDANPAGFQYVEDAKAKAFATMVNEAVAAGTPSDVAVNVARQQTFDLSEAERKAYAERYKGADAAKDNGAALRSFLDSDDRYDRRWFGGAPETPPALQGEFAQGVERYFAYTGGDLDKARQLAWRDVRRTWGYSEVNGQPQLLKYAPEAMFPGLTSDVVRADMAEAARTIGVDPAGVQLVPARETGRTNGRVWHLGVVDEYGALDIVRGPAGPLKYAVPVDTESLKAAEAALATQKVDEARALAKSNRDRIALLEQMAKGGDEEAEAALRAALLGGSRAAP